jgi:hypothetical protein
MAGFRSCCISHAITPPPLTRIVRLNMRIACLSFMCWWLVGCATAHKSQVTVSDPIDRLVAKLSTDDMWMNGYFTAIDLPRTASTEEIVAQALHPKGRPAWLPTVRSYQVVSVRQVYIGSPAGDLNFKAVQVDTNLGQKIVLLRYESQMMSWWHRTYDARPSA